MLQVDRVVNIFVGLFFSSFWASWLARASIVNKNKETVDDTWGKYLLVLQIFINVVLLVSCAVFDKKGMCRIIPSLSKYLYMIVCAALAFLLDIVVVVAVDSQPKYVLEAFVDVTFWLGVLALGAVLTIKELGGVQQGSEQLSVPPTPREDPHEELKTATRLLNEDMKNERQASNALRQDNNMTANVDWTNHNHVRLRALVVISIICSVVLNVVHFVKMPFHQNNEWAPAQFRILLAFEAPHYFLRAARDIESNTRKKKKDQRDCSKFEPFFLLLFSVLCVLNCVVSAKCTWHEVNSNSPCTNATNSSVSCGFCYTADGFPTLMIAASAANAFLVVAFLFGTCFEADSADVNISNDFSSSIVGCLVFPMAALLAVDFAWTTNDDGGSSWIFCFLDSSFLLVSAIFVVKFRSLGTSFIFLVAASVRIGFNFYHIDRTFQRLSNNTSGVVTADYVLGGYRPILENVVLCQLFNYLVHNWAD